MAEGKDAGNLGEPWKDLTPQEREDLETLRREERELPKMRASEFERERELIDKLSNPATNSLGITRTLDFRGHIFRLSPQDFLEEDEEDEHASAERSEAEDLESSEWYKETKFKRRIHEILEYKDILVTKGPGISVVTVPYDNILGAGSDEDSSIPSIMRDGYQVLLGKEWEHWLFQKGYDGTTDFKIQSPDRKLAQEIHKAIVEKLQGGLSPKEVIRWLVNESPYSNMKKEPPGANAGELEPTGDPHEGDLIYTYSKYYEDLDIQI